ncbi:Spx/MgsR family RNA polymerase-binding regulatory protein [Exiguobacterium flavidum]|uniref:Spx/MgsR family RNA polymerase-binding regulatory protein n=1 Tax=Exiguobacterium flavidum TaxID=2184695 RepID=UPI000DF776EF|nr:Spx/MgsR family RNA polymerase-binding regulatory protein [Exiguobacterium flavidum]
MSNSLIFFTYPSCTSCRKTKTWLKEECVEIEERHLFRNAPTVDELMELLKLSTDGIESLLATRSQAFKDLGVEIEDMKLSELLRLMSDNPKLLRRPILTDGKQLVIGYDKPGLETLTKRKPRTIAYVS